MKEADDDDEDDAEEYAALLEAAIAPASSLIGAIENAEYPSIAESSSIETPAMSGSESQNNVASSSISSHNNQPTLEWNVRDMCGIGRNWNFFTPAYPRPLNPRDYRLWLPSRLENVFLNWDPKRARNWMIRRIKTSDEYLAYQCRVPRSKRERHDLFTPRALATDSVWQHSFLYWTNQLEFYREFID